MIQRILLGVLILLMTGAVIQVLLNYPGLPPVVASHFDGGGQPNGWMSKKAFVIVYLGVLGSLGITMVGLARLLPRLPDSMINIPHKDFWLAEKRRDATLRSTQTLVMAMAVVTTAFLMFVTQLVFDANLDKQPLPAVPFLIGLFVYLLIVLGGATGMTLRLYVVPARQ